MRRANRNNVSKGGQKSRRVPTFISIVLIIFVIMAGAFSANADVKRKEAEAQSENALVSTSLNKKIAEENKKYLTNELNKNNVSETSANINNENGLTENYTRNNISNNSNVDSKTDTTSSVSASNDNTKENEEYKSASKSSDKNSTNTSSGNMENTNAKSVKDKVNEILRKDDEKFIMPVDGEIYKNFSTDGLVYSDTLQEWITHKGIDIKAEKNTPVKATKSGKIKAIKNDPRLGTSVIIEHSGGFESVYACLLNADGINVGDDVKQGDKIGEVGNSGVFEVADGSHLHFEILKDNENVNPELYF